MLLLLLFNLWHCPNIVGAEEEKDRILRVAVLPRPPFSKAEEVMMQAFGHKHGVRVDVTYAQDWGHSAMLVKNGSVDIASGGVMTDRFLGIGSNKKFSFPHVELFISYLTS